MTLATALPSAYPGHPHATDEFRRIAEDGLILRAEVGSGVHGIALPGTDDVDHMGICLEPPDYVTGLKTFEQFQRHTSWDRGGVHTPSGHGDMDVLIYSARKWCRLALAGNPSVLMLLFGPPSAVVFQDEAGTELLDNAHRFAAKSATGRFLGYLRRQRAGMTGEAGAKVKRPALVALHGYDSKYAAHAVRLGLQGVELLTHGHITLPIAEPERTRIVEIREGHVPLHAVVAWVDSLDAQLRDAEENSHLPERPDHDWVNRWLHRTYTAAWDRRGF